MPFINELNPELNIQKDLIRAKLFRGSQPLTVKRAKNYPKTEKLENFNC